MDDIWKIAAKKLHAREHRATTCAATALDVETDTTAATNSNPAVTNTEDSGMVQTTAPITSDQIEAELCVIEREWLEQGPIPEEYRVRIEQIRAREAAKLTEIEGDGSGVLREREEQEKGTGVEGEGKEGRKAEEAGVEEISDEERERRRKRNERKRKRKAEKEKEKESTKEQVNEVRTIPGNSSDDTPSRSPTGHVNAHTVAPPHPASPQTPPASSNNPIAPNKPPPTSSKPTAVSFTGDVAPATVQADGNEGVRGVRNPGKDDMKEVRTAIDTTSDDAKSLAPPLFSWADDVDATVASTPIALITPVTRAPRDFSGLCSSTRNPWGSLSRRHHRSQPRARNICHSSRYATYNYAPKLPAALQLPSKPALPVPIQLVETIRHPRGIGPTKPVVKTSSPVRTPNSPPVSTSSREPLSTVGSDSFSRPPCAFSLDWSGDPLLAGLARILEVLGWTRDRSAARTPLCLWGAHGIVDCG